ncbi:DUF1553 domain-containing protein [Armatimonas rosea]|uniref:LamG-like jellyroll fold domain-containing protein n=1 Tax=Armatimonas rosea TaxID=685828 RepID=A0A7W9SLH0_ARMRO|nr:DUF1553 domain-containing protein [Armatimonas rosea]MBB6048815.1 hypothetical protein [Armatimonas rosea]
MHRRLIALLPLALLSTLALARRETKLWSLQPVALPAVPAVKTVGWVRNPIDAFVLAKLEAKGLRPAPEADKRTLIRRVTFDLTGLPPTPQEIDAFLADTSPTAYEKLVDRLLASPHYGERWARHWLDVARFGESHGYEYDHVRENAWRYRDYVVGALNRDKPYDQFVREQLAGDVLPGAGPEGVIATGFLVAGPMDEAGKSAPGTLVRLRAREEELEDMIGVVGQTFLGLTTNCARCHDHKFDPISAKDYYRLKAALIGAHPGNRPVVPQEQLDLRARQAASLRNQQAEALDTLRRLEEPVRTRLLQEKSAHPAPGGPAPLLRWSFESLDGGTLRGGAQLRNGRLRLAGAGASFESAPLPVAVQEKTLETWVRLTDLNQRGGSALTLETDGGGAFDAIVLGERQRGKWFAGSEFYHRTRDLEAPQETPGELVQVAIVYHADNRIQVYRNGKPYGAAYTPDGEGASLRTYPAGKSHALFGLRHTGSGDTLSGEIEEARLYNRALTATEVAESFASAPFYVTPEALERGLSPDERTRRAALQAELERLQAQRVSVETPVQTYGVNSQRPGPTYILPRGDVQSQGELVTPGALSALTECSADFGLTTETPDGPRRLALATWVTNPKNPLTARVMVNRVWQGHFGRGIVGTPSDFGNNGEAPTHPELLDWFATAFSGPGEWSLKRLHRAILLSSTYRQSSASNPRGIALDPDNRLLWRMAPRRLEAEAIRDSMLAVSGKLNPAVGGPSFRPFTVSTFTSDFYTLLDRDTPEFNRRTLYRMIVQSARSPLLENFDCPDPSTKTARRTVTTTPLQALALMNDSFVLRQSRAFAERVAKEAGSEPSRQVAHAYTLAFGRPPTLAERTRALTHLSAHPLDSLCWALLNASEFLYAK